MWTIFLESLRSQHLQQDFSEDIQCELPRSDQWCSTLGNSQLRKRPESLSGYGISIFFPPCMKRSCLQESSYQTPTAMVEAVSGSCVALIFLQFGSFAFLVWHFAFIGSRNILCAKRLFAGELSYDCG